jgi:drug/metabolite transporter (DMT)-like permease
VIGFPLFSALALRSITSAHALVFIGLLPLSTATFGVWRGGERPHASFWIFALLGAGLVVGYAVTRDGAAGSLVGDTFMGLAVLVCGLGYAEGARLSRHLGGWQTISWALVYALPVIIPLACWYAPKSWSSIGLPALAGLVYVSLFSMLIGFIFWYRGLALGGIAAVGQLQLLQPFFGLVLAAGLLHEAVGWDLLAVSLGVVVCVAGAKRAANGIPSRSIKQRATLAATR